MHESFERHESLAVGSDRAFGLLFAALFALLAVWPMLYGESPRLWSILASMLLLALSITGPVLLHPANVAWMRFGALLARIGGFVGLALLYYGAFVPTGLLLRLFGKDPLNRRFERNSSSYWIELGDSARRRQNMRDQF